MRAGSSVRARPARPPEEPERHAEPEDDHAEHVGHARQEEERDASACDAIGLHARASQRPRSEREAPGSARGHDRIGPELGHPDLPAQAPAHGRAEDGAEDGYVGQAREQLEGRAEHEPLPLCMRKARAQTRQARDERDHRHGREHHDREQQGAVAEAPAVEARLGVEILAAQLRDDALRGRAHGSPNPAARCDGPRR
jgi:hypothetical protein